MTDLWPDFLAQIPDILASQDPTTGRFGTEPFIVTDQNVLWSLAVAWATSPPDGQQNPYHHDPDLLAAIVAGGDALIAVTDDQGMFEFRKKDNSTWGQIYMPWTYSRWIRAWALVRDAMPRDRRAAWDAALTLACDGMVATCLGDHIQNIPAHMAMGVYRAAQVLGRADWESAAVDYLHRTVDEQDEAGFWSEHDGPVVLYNFVYVDLLGCYHQMSGDPYVLPALERAATFHANFTYPDGTMVETIDERNPYRREPSAVGVGFLATPLGRGYLDWLVRLRRDSADAPPLAADALASMIAHGGAGPTESPAGELAEHRFVLGDHDARVDRAAPWFVAVSAYRAPQAPGNRWIQDRQAHLSVFHDRTGLVLSGSNTRLQPRWSTFTVGDTSLLSHRSGDEDPDFDSVPGLDHLPTGTRLWEDGPGLDLEYGDVRCTAGVELRRDGAVVSYTVASVADRPVEAHAGFVAHPGESWSAGPHSGELGEDPIRLTGAECGGNFAHHGWRVALPDDAVVEWPVRPHNPYTKDGSASLDEARIVVTLLLGTEPANQQLAITITG